MQLWLFQKEKLETVLHYPQTALPLPLPLLASPAQKVHQDSRFQHTWWVGHTCGWVKWLIAKHRFLYVRWIVWMHLGAEELMYSTQFVQVMSLVWFMPACTVELCASRLWYVMLNPVVSCMSCWDTGIHLASCMYLFKLMGFQIVFYVLL